MIPGACGSIFVTRCCTLLSMNLIWLSKMQADSIQNNKAKTTRILQQTENKLTLWMYVCTCISRSARYSLRPQTNISQTWVVETSGSVQYHTNKFYIERGTVFDVMIAEDTMQNVKLKVDYYYSWTWLR